MGWPLAAASSVLSRHFSEALWNQRPPQSASTVRLFTPKVDPLKAFSILSGRVTSMNLFSFALLTIFFYTVIEASHMPKLSRVSIDVVPDGKGSCELLQLHFQHLALQRQLHEASMQRRDLEDRLSSLVSRSKDNSNFLNSRDRSMDADTRNIVDNHVAMTDRGHHLRLRGGIQDDSNPNLQATCVNQLASRTQL